MTLEIKQLRRRKYNQRNHRTLKEGVKKKKTIENSGTRKGGGYSSIGRRGIQDIMFGNRTTN